MTLLPPEYLNVLDISENFKHQGYNIKREILGKKIKVKKNGLKSTYVSKIKEFLTFYLDELIEEIISFHLSKSK